MTFDLSMNFPFVLFTYLFEAFSGPNSSRIKASQRLLGDYERLPWVSRGLCLRGRRRFQEAPWTLEFPVNWSLQFEGFKSSYGLPRDYEDLIEGLL